ncbi:hypothetical protein Cni_G13798 [Canna indica]|uniref:Retrotransposon Copia-like N-terminal domain-containing protein n=1 Tax=Canna indica TaxID=4628 RepID=A0AAQ3KCR1_9LILI|nr:hypothetical protein Cni_G13798 [Canna indica]
MSIENTSNVSSQSSTRFVLQTFSNPVSIRLDENNFLPWKQQTLATIRGFKLQRYIAGSHGIPAKFDSSEDEAQCNYNEEYLNWEQQDQLLMSWLLSSMSDPLTTRMVGCEYSYQVWQRLEEFFSSQTKTKVKQLKSQ